MKKFYMTTAIAYTSAVPHIGNVYESILADSIARYKRFQGYDVILQTGTDEHGQKIQEKAAKEGKTPQQFVDGIAGEIKRIYKSINMSYDQFVRTTDDYHERQVQKIFKKLYDQGDIYKGYYEGMYCVPCESFFTESQLVDGKCPDCGREVKLAKEEAYFLKLNNYRERLVKHIKDNPGFIQPESRKNEMLNNFLKDDIPDLCVSRTSFDWGIKVDFDPKHVIYVWIDALTNYITGLGYDIDNPSQKFNEYWPADLHLIGKDILRFHTIYWPIMLMALNLPLPKQIFGHPWILFGNEKMSKSKGNILYTDELIKYYGVDAVRYYVLHEIPFAQDGSITHELLIERINSDLVNTLGNLVNRTISMSVKYFNGDVNNTKVVGDFDNELIEAAMALRSNVDKYMNELKVGDAIEEIIKVVRRANKYIDETEPWVLAKNEENNARLQTVLYNLLETIRICAVLLESFIPETSAKIYEMLKTKQTTYESLDLFGALEENTLDKPTILFNRIDANEFYKMLEEENKKQINEDLVIENPISIDDFSKVELKVGEILECKKHPDAEKLLVSKVDLGTEVRQIVSGIAKFYKPEEMVGKKVAVVTNLKPVKLRGVISQGMILCADNGKKLEVIEINTLEKGSQIR